ncbi:hypothetical protein GGQ03_002787 [Salinibacter ruber]|uniref:hypothetical protein n=1 Tax=Salinibacter ruber TaxID=146919 RepID=UPI00216752D8|nr:hypothetical protein [Salinibacter ruber]MCS4155484.1 hypothetical protein [Salinibacter ruber]
MDKFSYYDILGVIAPGTVFLAGLLLLFGDLKSARLLEGVSVGGLGIFALLAYAGGQMVQAVGNALENAYWWFWDGMPSDWVRTGRHEHLSLSDPQVEQLTEVCTSKLRLSIDSSLQDLSSDEWDGITSQIYAAVEAEDRDQRISAFNSNYGFHRGLTVAVLLLAVTAFINGWVWIGLAAVGAASITLYRMHRFARHYARELFVQALQLSDTPK